VVEQGKANKASGYDAICHDFYKLAWEIIKDDLLVVLHHMYTEGTILESQKQGIIVCVPKKHNPTRSEEYRPLTG